MRSLYADRYKEILIKQPDVLKDPLDKRDYTYKAPLGAIPKEVDLKAWADEVEDQGAMNSCTGNAGASAMELIYKRDVQEYDFSRLFLYFYLRQPYLELRGLDEGAYLRDIPKTLNHRGICLESTWPYDAAILHTEPTSAAQMEALNNKVVRYERIDPDVNTGNLNDIVYPIKHALSRGFPVLLGFMVPESFFGLSGPWKEHKMDPKEEEEYGGHAVVIIGYDDVSQRFLIENSWGADWGDGGFCGMRYVDLLDVYMDMWAITEVDHAVIDPVYVDDVTPIPPDPQPLPDVSETPAGVFIIAGIVAAILAIVAWVTN